jgi:hypothetical protein
MVMTPLLPQQKSSRIARTVSGDYDKGIDFAEFGRSDVSFGILKGLDENRTLYPPNSRMSDFRRRILIFVHNLSQLTIYRLLPNVSSPSENRENQIKRHG